MAVAVTSTVSNTSGLAEDFQDAIYNISPQETPYLTMAKRFTASARIHQWQEDSLAAATSNIQQEGDDASFTTSAQTTSLSSPCQIARKTVNISDTLDVVKKYGRKSERAYQLAKAGRELKRDMEFTLVRNQASATTTARATGGFECWISGNLTAANAAETTDYSVRGFSSGSVTAPEDGSAVSFAEANLVAALGQAWTDGGDPSVILMSSKNKTLFNSFSGVATKYNEVGKNSAQNMVVGSADVYVSSFGNHVVKLDRYVRDTAVLCIDPEYIGVAYLRPMKTTELARTGDGSKDMIVVEFANVILNRDAHALIGGVGK